MTSTSRPVGLSLSGALSVVLAVLRRPHLWRVAIRQSLRLAPTGWWRHAPFLPLPDPAYLRFRLVTAYGGDGSPPPGGTSAGDPAEDVVSYLEWCRAWPAVVGAAHVGDSGG